MKQSIFTGWNIQRIILLILGIGVIIQSVVEKQWLGLVPGVYLAAMGLLGFGCAAGNCYGNQCDIEAHKRDHSNKAGKA